MTLTLTLPPFLRTAAAPVVAVLLLLALPVPPAAAHEADPRLVTSVEEVVPALPREVVVQVQAGIASQLVVRNPTSTVLEVLDDDGRPFLRLSRAGVQADVGAQAFFTTSSPSGAAPPRAAGPPRWVRVSTGDSWGWYDHRLHPPGLRAPDDPQRPARLAGWEVPLRYGATDVVVRGRVDVQPLRGAFAVRARPAPAGLTVQALPGRLPGLLLTVRRGLPVTVLGRDGEPFLRFGPRGVEVNEASRTHVEDRQARGLPAGPPGPVPAFRLVAPGKRSWTWLDARLRYPQDLPPQRVLDAAGPTVVQEWDVPVEVAGARAALAGETTWVPEASAARSVRQGAAPPGEQDGPPVRLLLVGGGALLLLAGVVVALRRRT